jgi:hypothetical protein
MSLSLSPNSLYRQTTDCTEGGGLTTLYQCNYFTYRGLNKFARLICSGSHLICRYVVDHILYVDHVVVHTLYVDYVVAHTLYVDYVVAHTLYVDYVVTHIFYVDAHTFLYEPYVKR